MAAGLEVREFKGGHGVFDGDELITRTPSLEVARSFARGHKPGKAMDASERNAALRADESGDDKRG
ncbi:MAG TPA: hypothetical protein VJP45_07360 [Candidatus Limnocylindria bacterium]|nr:hypothetical protein [Candidatus Limnocylindria bacterium]